MHDYITRATAADGLIRVFIAKTTGLAEAARQIHDTAPVVTAALGRLLTAGAIMSCDLKNEDDVISLFIKGDGPVGGLTVTADSKANVKGYPNNAGVDLPLNANGKLDVAGAVGKGTLSVVADTGMKEPYVGQVKLVSGEIAEDLTYYFAQSEQIPTAVALGVLVNTDRSVRHAGGLMLQLMPGADETLIDILEERISGMRPLTSLYDEGHTPETVLELLLGDMNAKITDKIETRYHCDCSRQRVEKALITLGEKDIMDFIENEKKAELCCHFCGKKYVFNEDELRKLL